MSIYERTTRAFVTGSGLVLAALVVRCAPPDACLRHSDCGSRASCIEGNCREGASVESSPPDGARDASITDAAHDTSPVDAGSPSDAAADRSADAGGEPTDAEPFDDSTDF